MHGPTFMANALACAVAVASVELLLGGDWRAGSRRSRRACATGCAGASLPGVADVRVLGAIGVIEMERPVDMRVATPVALEHGVWLRPVPQPRLRDAAVHLHADEIGADHLGDGGRRPCTNLNGVQVAHEGASVTRAGLSPLAWLDEVERQRRAAGLRRSLRTRPPVGAELDLASNDYLGLSQHPDVIDGGVAALRTWGAGSTGSRLVTGNTELHEGFEARAGRVRRRRVGAGVLVGLHRQSRRRGRAVRAGLAAGLGRADPCVAGRRLPAVAGPGGGDAAPRRRGRGGGTGRPATRSARWWSPTRCSPPTACWPRCGQLHDVCRRHGALLIVDEAHGLGVRGTGGRGLLHEVGLAGAPDVVMTTTLSKALGSQGGVVLGPGRGARPPHRRRAAVHLRYGPGARRGRGGVGGAASVDRRAVARAGGAGARVDAGGDVRRRRAAGVGGGVGDPR